MKKSSISELKAKMAERDLAYQHAHQLSDELREMIDNSGLGVSELARRLGVTRGTIYSWKRRGRRGD